VIIYFVMYALVITFFSFKQNCKFVSSENVKKKYVKLGKAEFASGIVLIIIMGLRNVSVGADTAQYYRRYINAEYMLHSYSYEKGYSLISYFFHNIIHIDFSLYVFIVAVFQICCLLWFFNRYSKNNFICLIMFLSLGLFSMEMSGIRQSIAMSLILLSIYFVEKRKIIPFLALLIISYTIHNSAVFCIIIYFLYNIRLKRRSCWIIFAATLSVSLYRFAFNPLIKLILPLKYSQLDIYQEYDINILVICVPITFTIFYLLNIDKNEMLDKYESLFYLCNCIGIASLILSKNNNLISRFNFYFGFGNIIITSYAIHKLKNKNIKLATIAIISIVVLCILYFMISTPNGTLKIDNYKFYWQ